MTTTQAPRQGPTRRPRRRTALVVVAALLLAGVVWVIVRDDRPRVAVGEVVGKDDGRRIGGYSDEVLVPGGVVRVVVGAPTDELPAPCCTDEPAPVRPPDGGRFVGVEVVVESEPTSAAPVPIGAEVPQPTVVLVVSAEDSEPDRYPIALDETDTTVAPALPGLRTGRWSSYVGVAGEVETADLAVEVAYDEVVQVVDPLSGDVDQGDAAALEGAQDIKGGAGCGPVTWPPGYVESVRLSRLCSLVVQRTPYVVGPGWAEPGRTWVVVQPTVMPYLHLDTVVDGRRISVDSSSLSPPQVQVRLDGEPPTEPSFGDPYTGTPVLLFEVDADAPTLPLVLRARWSDLYSFDLPTPRQVLAPVTGTWRLRI